MQHGRGNQVEQRRLGVLPATLRYGRTAIDNAVEVLVHGIPARVVSVRDLLLLKLFAIPDRPDPVKAMQDRTNVAALLRDNADNISQEDITYLVCTLLGLAFTREEVEKYQRLILWLSETMDLLGMADRRYQEGEHTQGHPPL